MVLVRQLNKAEMGTWALFLSIITLFESAKSGLLKNAHIMYVNTSDDKNEKSAIASSSFIINVFITIAFIIFILFLSNRLSEGLHSGHDLAIMLKWFIPGLICMIFFSHFEAVQQSFLDFKGVTTGYLLRQFTFFLIIIIYLFFKKNFSLQSLAIYQSISIFFGTIAMYITVRKYLLYSYSVSKQWVNKILGYGKYIFGSGLISNISTNIDQLMTGAFMSNFYVSYYNVALRLNNFIEIPSFAAADIIFPKNVKASIEEGNQKVRYFYERITGILLSITTPIAIFTIIFPKLIITIIAGVQYVDAAPILQLYMLICITRPLQHQAANTLNSIGKAHLSFKLDTLEFIINVIANYICLTNFGFYGAAIGTFITCFIFTFIWYFVMKKEINFHLPSVGGHVINSYKILYAEVKNILSRKKIK